MGREEEGRRGEGPVVAEDGDPKQGGGEAGGRGGGPGGGEEGGGGGCGGRKPMEGIRES